MKICENEKIQQLVDFIKQNGVKVRRVAEELNVTYAVFYNILSGKKIINQQVIDKIDEILSNKEEFILKFQQETEKAQKNKAAAKRLMMNKFWAFCRKQQQGG